MLTILRVVLLVLRLYNSVLWYMVRTSKYLSVSSLGQMGFTSRICFVIDFEFDSMFLLLMVVLLLWFLC